MRVHVLQHDAVVGLGFIEDWFIQQQLDYSVTRVDLGESLPKLTTFDLLIVLGGRMGAYEEDRYPWLIEEKAYLRKVVDADKYVFGICLGSQLLADALGGKAYKNKDLELGWYHISFDEKTMNHPLLDYLDDATAFFESHFDTFDLPEKACVLGTTACAKQGFIYGDRTLAIQFHPEFNEEIVNFTLDNLYPTNQSGKFVQTPEQIKQNSNFSKGRDWLFQLLNNFQKQIDHYKIHSTTL